MGLFLTLSTRSPYFSAILPMVSCNNLKLSLLSSVKRLYPELPNCIKVMNTSVIGVDEARPGKKEKY